MVDAPILATVSPHGLTFTPGMRRRFQALRGTVEIRSVQPTRTLGQNAWVWGVAYPAIADALGYEPHEHEDVHYGLVAKWGGEHFDKRLGMMVPNKRSSKLTTKEFSDYMEWLVRYAAKECGGVVIPLPDEGER
jgi:hypothetical protein